MLWKLYFTTTKPYKGNFKRNFKKDGSDVKKMKIISVTHKLRDDK